jgi:heat shock protein HslJ
MEDHDMNIQPRWQALTKSTALLCAFIAQIAFAAGGGNAMADLENATYRGIEDQPVTLSQGRWEGSPYVEGGAARPAVGLVDDFLLQGDLDADGREELVVMLWQNASGTGSNVYIAVMKPENGGFVNISTALLGDRVKLRGGRIDAGAIILDVLQHDADDAMCCPTELAERSWSLDDGQLEEHPVQVSGKLSLDALEGTSWRMTDMGNGRPLPQNVEITLSFGAGRIAGSSACNRYSAAIRDGERPGDIVIGPAMVTRKACPEPLMETEMHFLDALSLVTSFSFQVGSLAMNGQADDGTPFSMLFSATNPGKP